MREFKGQKGFLTFAIGPSYLRMAYAQALSIKLAMPKANYAVIIDKDTEKYINRRHRQLFDTTIVLKTEKRSNSMEYECYAFDLTPWKETIKLDADVYFPESIDHWWTNLRLRDVCFTKNVYTFTDKEITSRWHRQLFDSNLLPNVYTALWYFRYTDTAFDLFQKAKYITKNWDWYAKRFLINNRSSELRTDEVFALAVAIVGEDLCTLPGKLVPSFTHMKEQLNELNKDTPWPDQLYTTGDQSIDVGFYPQYRPFHYYRKEWLTDARIRTLETNYARQF